MGSYVKERTWLRRQLRPHELLYADKARLRENARSETHGRSVSSAHKIHNVPLLTIPATQGGAYHAHGFHGRATKYSRLSRHAPAIVPPVRPYRACCHLNHARA